MGCTVDATQFGINQRYFRKMTKHNFSSFSPTAELVLESGIASQLYADETVQWVGRPNTFNFFLQYFSTGLGLGFLALAIADFAIVTSGNSHSLNERLLFCFIISFPLFLVIVGIMKLSTMLTYFVTDRRVFIKMAGTFFGLNVTNNHLKNNRDGFIFFEYSVVTSITVLENEFGFGEIDFSAFLNRDGSLRVTNLDSGQVSTKSSKDVTYIRRISHRSWFDMFAFSLGDRFRGVSDVGRISNLLEVNCSAKCSHA